MIKGDYFLKLLKPLFSILLIGFFGLLGSSFASFPTIGLTSQLDGENTCVINSDLSIDCTMSDHVLARRWDPSGNSTINGIFWSDGGIGVFHNHYTNGVLNTGLTWQGIMTGGFHICSGDTAYYVNNNYSFFADCIPGFTTVGGLSYNSLITKLTSEEPIYWWNAQQYGGVTLSLIYDDFYFTVMIDGYGSISNLNGTLNQSVDFGFGHGIDYENFNWNNINVWTRPLYRGSSNGSDQVNPDSTYTGDYTYTECTNGRIMNYAEKMGISPLLCQGGLDNWDLLTSTGVYDPIPGSGKWLDEIFGQTKESGQGAKDWFNYRNTAYINQYVSNQNIWYNKPAVLRFYFKFYNEYGGNNFDFDTVYEYCLMRKFYTRDNQFATQKYSGQYFKKTCSFINNGGWDGYNTGEDIIGLNWDGVDGLSGSKTYSDPGVFITDMFTKIKSYIPTDKSDIGLGFLPTYIITFMLFLILFRFLSH